MRQVTMGVTVTAVMLGTVLVLRMPLAAESSAPPAAAPQAGAAKTIDLAAELKAGKVRAFNREVTAQADKPGAIHLSEKEGNGVAWSKARTSRWVPSRSISAAAT